MIATLAIASIVLSAELSPAPNAPFARPDAPIRAVLSGVTAPCELALLDEQGAERGRVQAQAGELILSSMFPALMGTTQVMRVQTIVNGVPEGAPLMVVPLEVRPTIRVMTDYRPDGTTPFTRVIGWGDTLLDPSNAAHQALKQTWPKSDPSPLSGVRVERDRDVVFETTAGRIRFAMRPDAAPATARNFVELAANGFYNGTIVHRVVPKGRGGLPFVIQGGDPTGTGDGGPGYDIALEPSTLAHDFGVVSMARNDWPDSAGSQWFVALTREETARLDGQYCAFGQAVEGAETILAIEAGAIANPETGRPVSPVTITRAYAVPAPPWTPGKGRPDAPVQRPGAAPAASAPNAPVAPPA